MNSNIVYLIPKFPGVDRLENYRPIALANFQFKIITKVLADRLSSIAPKVISDQQRGFIKGRHIFDCICIASEASNMLDSRAFGGNLAMKFDIKKAFDTLDWGFLMTSLSSARELKGILELSWASLRSMGTYLVNYLGWTNVNSTVAH